MVLALRFFAIFRNIHFENNLGITDDARKTELVWEIRPQLFEVILERLLVVSAEEFQSLDEILVSFKCPELLKQYLPNKLLKWGSKYWTEVM